MAGENFVGGVNALYNRLYLDREANQLDLAALLAKQGMLRKQRREEDRENALAQAMSGVEDINDIPIGRVMQADPQTGINLTNALAQRQNATANAGYLAQKRQAEFIDDTLQMLTSVNSEPDESLRPQLYRQMLGQAAAKYPGIVSLIKQGVIKLDYDPTWTRAAENSLMTAKERYDMENRTPYTVQQGDEVVTYRGNREIGRGPKWSDREGLVITQPDGTVISQGGRGRTGTGLQPTVQKKVEEELLDNAASLAQLNQIEARFDPEFATYAGQAKGTWLKFKEKAGSELQPEERDYANKFYAYRSEAGKLQADIMRRMSGTAVTPTEEARQKTYVIDPGTGIFDGDSPEQVKSKLSRFKDEMRRVVARLNYVRKNGISIRNVSLDTMDKIIQDRGEVIEGNLRKQGVPSEEIPKRALKQLSEEFGLVY